MPLDLESAEDGIVCCPFCGEEVEVETVDQQSARIARALMGCSTDGDMKHYGL
jgi:uncharacterized Zn finger protein (UPF0148 family)